jgi:hypothetical protein
METQTFSKTRNYSFNRLVSLLKTDEFLQDGGTSTERTIEYFFNIKVNPQRLKDQALVFATNFRTHGVYNFERLFGCRDHHVKDILEEMYIYSYLKALYSIYFDEALTNNDMCGFCFAGHSRFYYLIQRKNYIITDQNISTSVSIKLGSKLERIADFTSLLHKFKFMEKYLYKLPTIGQDPFIIDDFEKRFSKLVNDYYAKRSDGEPDYLSDKKDFSEGKNLANVSIPENEKGKVQICQLRNEDSLYIIKDDGNPLTNTFFSDDCSVLHHIEVNNGYQMKFNESFFFNLANFIVIDKEKSQMDDINRYYKSTVLTRKQKFIVNSEVYAITGIKPRISVIGNNPIEPMTITELPPNGIREFLDRLPQHISEFEEILEYIDELLKENKEKEETEGK